MLDQRTVEVIKATIPAVKANANAITEHFYPLLFNQYPEIIPYFNQTNQGKGIQAKALAGAVVAYAENIDSLGNLSSAVEKIVQKHCALGIEPSQYDMVGSCLLQSIKAVLGEAANEQVIAVWGKAYQQLADILISAEESVYSANENRDGGWRGERAFKLFKREKESQIISSFYFKPVDGCAIPTFKPGQFLTLVLEIEGKITRRNYSLSNAPNKDYLRISVKREPKGLASNYLHDKLELGKTIILLPPCGDFTLHKNDKPLVLLTGGVGITPAISMLNTEVNSKRDIHFIHAALNSQVHAFKQHVTQLTNDNSNVSSYYLYSQPTASCEPNGQGFITAELIASLIPDDRDVEYYFLGPKPFMSAALKIAQELGIPEGQIHYEFFGPSEALVV